MIIHSTIPFHLINAHDQYQVRSIGCCHLQNGCQLHYHAADSVLISGCSFIGQQIRIKIFIMLAVHGICIIIEAWRTGKTSMYNHISGWLTFDFGYVSCLIVTRWNRWRFWSIWRWFWSQLSCRSDRGTPVPLCLVHVWGFYAVPFCL